MRRTLGILILAALPFIAISFVSRTTEVKGGGALLGDAVARIKEKVPFFASRKEPLTVLLLGKAGEGWTSGELTDTILVARVPPDGSEATLLSLPRDMLVRLPNGNLGKINALWAIGKQNTAQSSSEPERVFAQAAYIQQAVEEITGITVDEIVVVDVAGAEQAVNLLNGIAVNVHERIDDPAYPTPGGGVERFTIEPGFQTLDGKTAIKYARTRHTSEGDFGRIRRQQQVIEAVMAKARGLKLFEDMPRILELYEILEGHIESTFTVKDIPELVPLAKNLRPSAVRTFALESLGGEPLLTSYRGTTYLVPREGVFTYAHIHETVARLFEKEK